MNMDDEAMDRFEATLKNEDSVNRKIGLKRIFDIQLMEDLGLCQRWRLEVHHDGMNPRTLAQVDISGFFRKLKLFKSLRKKDVSIEFFHKLIHYIKLCVYLSFNFICESH